MSSYKVNNLYSIYPGMFMLNFGLSRLFLLTILTLSACAAPEVQDKFAASRSAIKSVSVEVGDFAPGGLAAKGASPGKSAATGAVVGAAPGAVGMAGIAPLCASPYTVGVCAVFMPIFGLMAAAGGGAGATYGKSGGSMKAQAQQSLSNVLLEESVQQTLVSHIADYGATATNLNFNKVAAGTADSHLPDATLEVAMLKVDGVEVQGGFFGIISTGYAINMEARARLKRLSDGEVMAERTYRYLAAPRAPKEWTDNDGKSLVAAIDDGYHQLAEWVVDDFFLGLYADTRPIFPMPAEPIISKCTGHQPCTKHGNAAALVDGLRPILRWDYIAVEQEHSPTETRQAPLKVSYEVRVFLARQIHTQFDQLASKPLWPMKLVYSRSGLTDTSHALEEDLLPCSHYLWTVRAIIEDDENKRVTEWSGNYFKGVPPLYLRQTLYATASTTMARGTQFNYAYPFSTSCQTK